MKFNIGIEMYFDCNDKTVEDYLEKEKMTIERFKEIGLENIREIILSEIGESDDDMRLVKINVKEIE